MGILLSERLFSGSFRENRRFFMLWWKPENAFLYSQTRDIRPLEALYGTSE